MSSFRNKNVLVTGGAKGIGKLLGLESLKKGAHCLIVWDIDGQALDRLQSTCAENDWRCLTHKVDLTNPKEIREATQGVQREVGTVNILFNNAGIVVGKSFIEHSNYDIAQTLAVNVEAVMLISRAFLPGMVEQNSGHIINISSASALMGNPNMSVYAGSKWAVSGWSESLRIELEQMKSNVRVTTVQPSYINTGMFAGVEAPRLTPLLDPEYIANKIIGAVIKNKIILREPLMVKITPFLKGILPARIFDFIAGKLFKVYTSMDNFTGRGYDE